MGQPNPYRVVHRLLRQRRPLGAAAVLLPVLAAAITAPLARPVLLGFLDSGAVPAGMEAISFRLGALVISAMALHTYSDLVRGPDRAVLDPHPVKAQMLLSALAHRALRSRLYLPLMGALILAPVAIEGYPLAWLGGVGVVFGSWLAGLGLGFAVNLGGVWAAFSPGLARLMDALRGGNPRMQAALIYAPAVALAVGGLGAALAASGLRAALEGWAPGWAWLLIPPALGVAGLAVARPLAEAWYVRATALLAEIDALWAGLEGAEDARLVYLEWTARGRPELLRALRQGWRRLRAWATGAWLLGFGGALAGWSGAAGAEAAVLAVAGGAVALLAALPTRLAEGDPAWLDLSLGVKRGQVAVARGLTAFLYAQGAVLPAVAALSLRHGVGAGLRAGLAVEALAAVSAALGAAAAARWGARGVWFYGPAGLILWAAFAGLGG